MCLQSLTRPLEPLGSSNSGKQGASRGGVGTLSVSPRAVLLLFKQAHPCFSACATKASTAQCRFKTHTDCKPLRCTIVLPRVGVSWKPSVRPSRSWDVLERAAMQSQEPGAALLHGPLLPCVALTKSLPCLASQCFPLLGYADSNPASSGWLCKAQGSPSYHNAYTIGL